MNERDKGRALKREEKALREVVDVAKIRDVVVGYNLDDLNIKAVSGNKATSLVSYKRTTEIVKLILSGIRYTDIMEYCVKNWGIQKRMASIYYKKALESFVEQSSVDREFEIDKHQMMIQDLYNKGYKSGDLNICRLLLQDLAKMKGISIDRVDVTSGGDSFVFNYKTPDKKEVESEDS
jgi:hypothetical protein|tara:strand:+ start:513 stop:1049 length:537 start_codon:yes stop_codon:yes gene_type:complete